MTLRFFYRANKDAGKAFVAALETAGYQRTESIQESDFLLMDHDDIRCAPDLAPYFTLQALKQRPLFIYPHVPYSWFLWDGIIEPKAAACNFVVSNGAKTAMQLYGYPCHVEVIGFPGVQIKPFKPTHGTKLLFAPAHPLNNGKFPGPRGIHWVRQTSEKIIHYLDYFESVTVRYHAQTLADAGLELFERIKSPKIVFENVDVYKTSNIRQKALRAIDAADLVISQATFGYLSVACGKPTVFYGYSDQTLYSREGIAKQSQKYWHIFKFPKIFEELSIEEALAVRVSASADVERWCNLNLGENFDPKRFVETVENYL